MRWGKETARHGKNVAARPEMNVSFLGQSATNQGILRGDWMEAVPDELAEESTKDNNESKRVQGKHMTYETLSADKQELTIRGYINTEKPSTLLIFMADYGIEGWPRVVHGGVTTSLIYDALRLHAKHYPDQTISDNVQVDLNYRRPIDTRKTYVVSLQTRVQDPADNVPTGPYVSHVIDVKVREMKHQSEGTSPNGRPGTLNVEGTAVILLASAEKPQLFEKIFARVRGTAAGQHDTWIQTHNRNWKEQQRKKLDNKPAKTESGNR